MDKSRRKSAVLFVCILVVWGMWMMLSVYCQAAEMNNDENQPQTIRVAHLRIPLIMSTRTV